MWKNKGFVEDRVILDERGVARKVEALASMLHSYASGRRIGLVGIQTGGVFLAKRLLDILRRRGVDTEPLGILDITLYRDDILLGLQQPLVRHTDIPFEVNGADIVLVDDVLYTGRTARAGLEALVEFGRPKAIRLCVLVDRGLREYPIQPDFVGIIVETKPDERVQVELRETGSKVDRVVVYKKV